MSATITDAILGQAIGDALGVPYEFRRRGTFHATTMTGHGTHGQPAGTWSDDTSMALAICDSIRRNKGRIDPDDIRRRFDDWYQYGEYTIDGLFDIGNTTVKALRAGHGMTGEYDNGNGSLMRTIPLAFTRATEAQVEQVSAITHANTPHTLTIDLSGLPGLPGLGTLALGKAQLLHEDDPYRTNTAEAPEAVTPQPLDIAMNATGTCTATLPAISWISVEFHG